MEDPLLLTNTDITEIYYRHVDMVYRICFMFHRNAADTEDAVQTVFLKLIQSGTTFADSNHEKAWLIVASQNHCKNGLKHWWKRNRVDIERLPEGAHEQVVHEVFEQLLALPHKYRIVLYLFYYEGYSSKEIADMLKLKDSTIRTQLSNGRKQFKLNF